MIWLLLFSCTGEKTEITVEDVSLEEVKGDSVPVPPPPIKPGGVSVSAYLVYKDSTLSTFDVLNDSTIALWNTVIGAGDAVKPSEKTKVVLAGELANLQVVMYNGKRKVIDQKLPDINGDMEFFLDNTGCDEVKISLSREGRQVYSGVVPYRCGE
ncbi:MAG: hypothetical protein K0Q66_1845 [Chitinophagaceae bacterium]|nr:hypothetical protein [Chitinophagaceae bacterium]